MPVGITGTGVGLPQHCVDNVEVAETTGVDAAWIEQRTGILERRFAAPGDTVTSLAVAAARAALLDARRSPGDIDLVLLASCSGERALPPLAPGVAAELGVGSAGAFDVGAACNGFVSALAAAAGMIAAGNARSALVIGSEVLSRIIDPTDPMTYPLFGDGAGAVVIEAGAPGGIGPFVFGCAGEHGEILRTNRATGIVEMKGREVYKRAIEAMSNSVIDVATRTGISVAELKAVVPHQANERITRSLAERLGLESERMVSNISLRGNTSAASVPIALGEAHTAGRFSPGDHIVLTSVGAGLVWSACLITWGIERRSAHAELEEVLTVV